MTQWHRGVRNILRVLNKIRGYMKKKKKKKSLLIHVRSDLSTHHYAGKGFSYHTMNQICRLTSVSDLDDTAIREHVSGFGSCFAFSPSRTLNPHLSTNPLPFYEFLIFL